MKLCEIKPGQKLRVKKFKRTNSPDHFIAEMFSHCGKIVTVHSIYESSIYLEETNGPDGVYWRIGDFEPINKNGWDE